MSNLGRIILISLAMLIALNAVACGATSPTLTPTLENTPLPPENSSGSVDVGGYTLAYQCFGQGTPTVIVETAVNDAPTVTGTWDWVTDEIQTITHICIYDRAGLGPSGAAPTPRTSQDVAKDLHVLLSKIPLPGPYILVGHSIGGFHVRVFANLYPQDVAGVILVDSTPPDQMKAFATAYPTYTPNEASILTSNRAAIFDPVPPSLVEGLDMIASAEQVRQAGSLGDLPLIVISQSLDPNHFVLPGFSLEDQERLSASWQRQQADIATLSSKGVLMTAKTAGHYIPLEDPQIVIDAITQMVQEIRKQGTRSHELHNLSIYIGLIIGIVIVVLSFLLLILKKRPNTGSA
jgi:pimeloyl-ACP methyl ester carboxylesterase